MTDTEDIPQEPQQSAEVPKSAPMPEASSPKNDTNDGIVVHHLDNSRSRRLLWLLEELEIPYKIEKHTRSEDRRAPQSLKEIHSLGKAPVLIDGGVTIAESGAIIEYIISKYGNKFRPTEKGKIDDIYFSHYAEGSIMPVLVNGLIFQIVPQRSSILMRPLLKPVFEKMTKLLVEPELKTHAALIESQLEKSESEWLAGCDHPTSADFMMIFPAEILVSKTQFAGPKLKQYVEHIHKRPAFKRALEKGGELEFIEF